MKPQTEKLWCIVTPEGAYSPTFFAYRTKGEVIENWSTDSLHPWKWWYKQGYRAKKVTVTTTEGW